MMSVSTSPEPTPGLPRPWWQRYRWLALRRLSQFTILGLFLLGPWFDIWWVKGNLASSEWLDTIPLSDPYIVLQSFAASGYVAQTALLGAALIFAGYWLVGGRVFCSWVCPVNVITDAAHWCRERIGIPPGWRPNQAFRYWLLGMTLIASALTSSIAWELVNPVTMVQRALVFGIGMSWTIIAAVFFFDLIVSRRGWCGHLCPVGAFYSLVGTTSPVRVAAKAREACTDCGDCFDVCPEPHVITPALRGIGNDTRLILSGNCTNCGRCIDVCEDRVFAIVWKPKAPV